MKTLLILNDPAYGTERSYNGLRLAGALAKRDDSEVRVFLGRSTVHGALYAPGAFPGLAMLGTLLETAGRVVPGWGAFHVLVVDKERDR